MKLSIGADHGGFELKEQLRLFLESEGHSVMDRGTHGTDSVDYPDYAKLVGSDIIQGHAELGVVVCTSGLGIAMAANKIPGIRAAVVHNEDAAFFSRSHNNANIIAFGQKYDAPYMAKKCLKLFLETEFEAGGRHEHRVGKMESCCITETT